ncbi:MAG: NYN domain-containing protein [Pseudomonadota bacterium]
MNDDTRVALLIDADNLSGDVIEQAIQHLLRLYGAIHFRRAYSSPQKVTEHTDLFKRYAIRPMVNVPTGKNSTDIALAVDAIDLAICESPDVVVIASSDSDYAPLAQRLREKGCRVLGIGQAGKTGGEAPLAYDEFIDLAHRRTPPREAPRSAPAPRAAPRSAPSPAPAPAPRPARARAAASASAPAAPKPPAPAPARAAAALPHEVEAVLQAVPALRNGAALQLGEVSEALRRHEILTSKRASASGFLKRLAAHFELVPADRPRTVRFRGD